MTVDTDTDVVGLQAAGRVVANCLVYMQRVAEPGMATAELDALGRAFLERHGAQSAPIKTYDFPGATCISVNEEVAHGVPGKRVLCRGDLVNIDVSAELDGYVGDTGGSFVLGQAPDELQQRLCEAAMRARDEAILQVRAGRELRVIGRTVERVARESGFSVIRNLGSHGVGRRLHEEPSFIPGFEDPRDHRRFSEGMVITVEPFLTTGKSMVREGGDGWTLLNRRGSYSAQYEHTIIVTRGSPIITTLPDAA
ncbi:MAG: type I methionyl aminopeptidase [Alphaproteobacteria bacterium]|nr:type I methionyl aminopeptidase [Alphaproteobacteria bacterium]